MTNFFIIPDLCKSVVLTPILIAKAKSHQIGVKYTDSKTIKLQNIHISIKFGILAVFFGFDAKRLFCKGFFN